MSYSRQLADFVCATHFNDIPAPVTARARQLLIDTLGVGLAGSRHPNAVQALAGIKAIPGAIGERPVIGSEVSLTAPYAALVNGVACHALDFDDTHTESIVHGSAILAPLTLALAEETAVSGRAALTAFILGWEVAARIGIASGNSFHQRGFHSTAIAGIFGAIAAAGKLLGLSPEHLTHAFGLGGSQAAGINEFLSNNSAAKGYHVGWAAHNAMLTAWACRAGATGPATVFEGQNGLFNTHGLADRCEPAATVAELGRRWEIERVSIKPYPCCHFAHGAVDCALGLFADGISAVRVDAIQAIIDEVAAGFVCKPIRLKRAPGNAYGAKFSLPYLIARALVDGRVDQDAFTEPSIRRADLLAVARKVSYAEAARGATGFPKYFPGHLIVTLTDGQVIERRVAINRGHPDAPLSDAEIAKKFSDNVKDILPQDQARALINNIAALDEITDIAEVTRALRV